MFRQGDAAYACFLLIEGSVKWLQLGPDGAEILLHVLGQGDLIGAMPTLGLPAYPGSAVALSHATGLAISGADFDQMLRDHLQVAINLLEAAEVIQETLARLRETCTLTVKLRIALTLWRLAGRDGRPSPEGIALNLRLTLRDLAGLSGTTLYTVSRMPGIGSVRVGFGSSGGGW